MKWLKRWTSSGTEGQDQQGRQTPSPTPYDGAEGHYSALAEREQDSQQSLPPDPYNLSFPPLPPQHPHHHRRTASRDSYDSLSHIYGGTPNQSDFLSDEEEYQTQLALAMSISQQEAKQRDSLRLNPDGGHHSLSHQDSLTDGTRSGPRASSASELVEKYWYTRRIHCGESILDGFYDCVGNFDFDQVAEATRSAAGGSDALGTDRSSQQPPSAASTSSREIPDLRMIQSEMVYASASPEDMDEREILLVDRRADERLVHMAKEAEALSSDGMSCKEKAIALGNLVVENMGGSTIGTDGVGYARLRNKWLRSSHAAKERERTYVVKLGDLSCGMSRHRALLYKVLSEEVEHLGCQLVKGCFYYTDNDAEAEPSPRAPQRDPGSPNDSSASPDLGVPTVDALLFQDSVPLPATEGAAGGADVGGGSPPASGSVGVSVGKDCDNGSVVVECDGNTYVVDLMSHPVELIQLPRSENFGNVGCGALPGSGRAAGDASGGGLLQHRSTTGTDVSDKSWVQQELEATSQLVSTIESLMRTNSMKEGGEGLPGLSGSGPRDGLQKAHSNHAHDALDALLLRNNRSSSSGEGSSGRTKTNPSTPRHAGSGSTQEGAEAPSQGDHQGSHDMGTSTAEEEKGDDGERAVAREGLGMDQHSQWNIKVEEVRFGDRVGIGSFGEVYRGMWRGTEVAIKKLIDQDITTESKQEFLGEVSIMRRLRHPNIVLFMGVITTQVSSSRAFREINR